MSINGFNMRVFRIGVVVCLTVLSTLPSFSQTLDPSNVNYDPSLATPSYKLVQDSTFSFRAGSHTYLKMASFTSSAYREGYLTCNEYGGHFQNNYRLMLPGGYNATFPGGYPMIIMLHGAGERGNCATCCNGCYQYDASWDPFWSIGSKPPNTAATGLGPARLLNNDANLNLGGAAHQAAVALAGTKLPDDPSMPDRAWPGFLLFPQMLNNFWYPADIDNVIRIVKLLQKKYNIDPNRIFVHGLSAGGEGTYEIIQRAPWLIAGALPMSAITDNNIVETGKIETIATVPIWQFQGGTDTAPKPSFTQVHIDSMRAHGMDVRLTIYPTLGHSVWNNAYLEPDFFSWMRTKNKANIWVRYGVPTLCPTNTKGVEMQVSPGFLAYQWEKDGVIQSRPLNGAGANSFITNTPGTFRVRFSRVSTNPTEAQWNRWSDPVVVRDGTAVVPVVTSIGTTHLPGPSGETTVTLKGPAGYSLYRWYQDGAYYYRSTDTVRTVPVYKDKHGNWTVVVTDARGCQSLPSQAIPVVNLNTPPFNIANPSNLKGVVTSSTSINVFWNDNSTNESAFELYRRTKGYKKYTLIALTAEDAISFLDKGVKPDSSYTYLIRAISPTAQSDTISSLPIKAASDNIPPTAPQNLKVVSKVFTDNNNCSMTLTWSPATDNSGIKEYVISYTVNNGTIGTPITVPGNVTTYVVPNLSRNRGFTFTVVARDIASTPNTSAPSNQVYAESVISGLNYFMSEGAWTTMYNDGATTNINWTKIEDTGVTDVVSLAPRKQDDFFYLRFEGFLNITSAATNSSNQYTFYLTAKTSSALFLGTTSPSGVGALPSTLYPNVGQSTKDPSTNRLISLNQIVGTDSLVTKTGSQNVSNLPVGVYPISVLFYEYSGPYENLTLEWAKAGSGGWSRTPIPASAFVSGGTTAPNLPSIPTTLAVTSPTLSSLTLTWNWAQGTGGNNTGIATGYEVYRSDSLNGTYAIIAQIKPQSTKTFTDTKLTPLTTYYYKVKAIIDGVGSSDYSTVASGTTTTDTTPPSVPDGLTIQTQNYTDVGLSWNVSTDNVKVTAYNVYSNGTLIGTSTTNTFAVTGLVPGSSYALTVSAKDASGNESAQSAPVNVIMANQMTYYYKGTGAITSLSSWGSNQNGTGTPPSSFATNGQYFVVKNTPVASLGGASWTVSGNVSKIIVSSGTTLTVDNAIVGKISVLDGATVNVTYASTPTFESLAPSSTINFNVNGNSTIPQATYGNLTIGGSGVKTLASGTTIVSGDLTVGNGITLKGLPFNGSSINVSGNLIYNGTHTDPVGDENIAIRMDGTNPASISINQDFSAYTLTIAASKTVTFTNASPINVNLGSQNGGGLVLENGSVLNMGNNNLNLISASTVNAGGQTGQIDMTGGDVTFTSSATATSSFNFGPVGKTVGLFTLNLTGSSAAATIGRPVTLNNGLKIKQGIFNANGNVTLESNATTTASIREIENGGVINGAVTVKRYAAPQGQVYRYISFPVAGVKVSDMQSYVAIGGKFVGSNGGSSATLYRYTTDWVPFPSRSNSEAFDRGRGYSLLNQAGNSAVTWQTTGVPYQGTIAFANLTGGSAASGNGWNLLGNPYAAPIVWNTGSGWQSSGLGTTVYVRYNHDGISEWQYWNLAANGGQGAGTLPGGKIPAGQAFWIQASNASPSLTVKESAKSADNGSSNTNFYRENTTPAFGSFRFTLTGNGKSDPTFVFVNANENDRFDKSTDSEKQQNSYFNLSTFSSDSVKLAINQLSGSFTSCNKAIGINIENVTPGQYVLNADVASWTGNVVLRDKYLNTKTSFAEGKSYSFAVTSDPKSYGRNRFTIELASPDVDPNAPKLSASASLCAGNAASVTLSNTQNGISYAIANAAGEKITSSIAGNGQPIAFTVTEDKFAQGMNTLHVVAESGGCASVLLPTSATITYSQIPTVTVTAESASICSGSKEIITASGASDGGSYQWVQHDQHGSTTLRFTDAKLETDALTTTTIFLVQAVNASGCVSDAKMARIDVTDIEAPEITQSGNTFYSSSDHNNQWLKDGEVIPGMTGISYEAIEPGVYSVRLTINGCAKDSEPIYYLVSGLEVPSTNGSYWSVYPNPTNQHNLQVRGNIYGAEADEVTIELIDTNGHVHVSTQYSVDDINNGIHLDTSSSANLASGVYMVVMKVGTITSKKKVMIN